MPNMYYCSDGSRVSEATIKRRYSESLKTKHQYLPVHCEGCSKELAAHNDHTIAKARCKVIHKTELIWNHGNYVSSCPKCHREWEDFKSGDWVYHDNVTERLDFLKKHDPEGFTVRKELTILSLEQRYGSNNNSSKEEV